MKKLFVLLLFLLIASHAFSQTSPSHWPTRAYIQYDVVGSIGTGKVLMLGDSITEMFWWNLLNNQFVLNAGQGAAGIDEVTATAQAIVPIAQPHVATVMVGINDCGIGNTTDPAAWGIKFTALLNYLHSHGVVPVVLTILPVEQNPNLTLGVNFFDTNCYMALNGQIWNIATTRGEVAVNLNNVFGVPATGYRYMNPGWTMDGVHPYGIGMSTLYYQINPAVATAWGRAP